MIKPILNLFFFFFLTQIAFGQKNYKTPVHSLGLEISQSVSLLSNMRFDIVLIESYSPGFGASFLVPYQYAPKSSFFGFQTGLGFYMWGTRHTTQALSGSPHAPATITSNEKQSMYFLGIPLVSQFKLAKSFWLELGLQSNVPVYHSGVYAEIEHSGDEHPVFPTGFISQFEVQGLFGFQYNIYNSLSIRFRLNMGINSAYRIEYTEYTKGQGSTAIPTEKTDSYRLTSVQIGVGYLFPLKK